MRIKALHVRLYKAFNYDFLRLHDDGAEKRPWDRYEGTDYPYISVPIDKDVTCIVGANESGKSQLLSAMYLALGYGSPTATDSCRYSIFFGSEGNVVIPNFGLTIDEILPTEQEALVKIDDSIVLADSKTALHIFREGDKRVSIFVGTDKTPIVLDAEKADDLFQWLPQAFSIDPKKELPDSVPLKYLIDRSSIDSPTSIHRVHRSAFIDSLLENADELERILPAAGAVDVAAIRAVLPSKPQNADKAQLAQFELSYHLLVTVGGLSPSLFEELHKALRLESEGLATAIVKKINEQLSRSLNFSKWWSQDTVFDIQVAPRDFDLVFTVKDRTASEYMFAERSSGMKYFLSYLVQYLTKLKDGEVPDVLLMDEPDAYLSHQGQQDLLGLFQDFVQRDRTAPRQVVFVTHSPFLLDRNRPERIRVLHKGADDEGTRVINKAAHNHFEPLRTAFGGLVGETAFIGNCNMIMEGQVDQIYIAGLCGDSITQRAEPTDYLDLNKVTLVASGGATHVPYMTYLARGRDHDQPAVVVLVDGDSEGDLARELIATGFRRGREKKPSPLLNDKFVIQINSTQLPGVISDRPGGPVDIEDLVPLPVLLNAAKRLSSQFCATDDPTPTIEEVRNYLSVDVGHLGALCESFSAAGSLLRIDKVAMAREVLEILTDADQPDLTLLRNNFQELFRILRALQHLAETERREQGSQKQARRSVMAFLKQHPDRATRDELRLQLIELDRLLDDSPWADAVRVSKLALERDLGLKKYLGADMDDYPIVRRRLEGLIHAPDVPAQKDPKDRKVSE
jgi:AAA domain, putative AbiEii toxin, Type IV TA system